MRLVLAVIASACAIATLIDSPRRELAAQLEADWREYRQLRGTRPETQATQLQRGSGTRRQ